MRTNQQPGAMVGTYETGATTAPKRFFLPIVLLRAACLSAAWLAAQAGAAERVFDVADFGAAGDGRTLCTPALQKAIDAAGAAGGGIVRFPPAHSSPVGWNCVAA